MTGKDICTKEKTITAVREARNQECLTVDEIDLLLRCDIRGEEKILSQDEIDELFIPADETEEQRKVRLAIKEKYKNDKGGDCYYSFSDFDVEEPT